MLTSILNNAPSPKFVLIQDSLSLPGKNVLLSILKTYLDHKKQDIHLFCFENNPENMKLQFLGGKINIYDYISDFNGWINDKNSKLFINFIENSKLNGIIVIDSLSHLILEFGIIFTYKLIHKLLENSTQIITLLHVDTLENKNDSLKYFEHLSTLNLKLDLIGDSKIVEYKYKKSTGKIIKKIEEYYFTGNIFQTKSLEKINPKILLPGSNPQQLPENLSTFKISLDENEKKSREKLFLPYTAKSNLDQNTQTGNVIYNLDDVDDWDDEDPDDDLDI